MTERGFLFTVEGIDGGGKTTHAILLESYLKSKGREVIRTREPGDYNLASSVIRKLILSPEYAGQIPPQAELCLFAASRAIHVDTLIRPALSKGIDVITDRFADSTFAYQGIGRGMPLETILLLNMIVTNGLTPDLTIFIDTEESIAEARTATEEFGLKDRIESEETKFHKRVNEGYRALALMHPQRIKRIVYKSDNIEAMQREIISYVDPLINQ